MAGWMLKTGLYSSWSFAYLVLNTRPTRTHHQLVLTKKAFELIRTKKFLCLYLLAGSLHEILPEIQVVPDNGFSF